MQKEVEYGFVKWFSELSNKDVGVAGGKGASLAEMYNHKFPIPPGFIVTAQAYSYFIEKSGIGKEIDEIIEKLDIENTKQLDEASKKIKEMVGSAKMPQEMQQEIIEAYDILDVDKSAGAHGSALQILKRGHEPPFVAVRSSATTEDLVSASFAGQQESFLNVKGEKQLIQKVKECFASLFTARAIYYRAKKGFAHAHAKLAVVVQRMVDSDKSGVIFSRNPIKNDDTIMIEAVWGLGEGIVSGMIKPDNYVISRDLNDFNVIKQEINEKKVAITRDSSGENKIVKLTEDRSKQQVLSGYELKFLSQQAIKLEEHYKKPQDIEFAISGKDIYVVQSRPVTTKTREAKGEIEGNAILSGLGASPGVGSGVVKLVHSLEELEKVKKGDVLVTVMTNPDMVVSMQKAAAIVTDEGGITCFSGDTNVLTAGGFMSIKDAAEIVNSGKEVLLLAYDTRNMKPVWRKVISAASRKRNVIRISVSQRGLMEDNTIDLTPDHKMLTFDNRKLIKEEISSILCNNKHLCLIDFLPLLTKVSREKLAYLMGALLTDGCIVINKYHTGNPRRGIITFTQKDIPPKTEFIKTVRLFFEECFGDSFQDGRIKHSSNLYKGRVIQGFASDYICGNLDVALRISKLSQNLDSWTLGLDYNSSLSFLAGVIDGDGSFYNNRLNIYVSKENLLQGIIVACLNIGIFPQVTRNRNIYNVQILEKISEILCLTKRVSGELKQKELGNKLFSAKQVIGDIIEKVNYKGRIKPYVNSNLLIDSRKIAKYVLPMADEGVQGELKLLLKSGLRMQRVKQISAIGETEVYNLEIEADNEMDHNFVVFTKKYTPLLVSNSHAAIVSREMGIPAVVGTEKATSLLKDGMIITVDGSNGKVYEGKGETRKVEILPIVPTKTKIKVIVDLPDYAKRAALSGAKAVGLVRLEGIIAESGKHPLLFVKKGKIKDYEDIIYKGLKQIAEPFEEIWVRTSDIRSDEFVNIEGAPKETEGNPMLGDHGVRFSLKHKDIMKAEINAMHRLAMEHKEKVFGIMVPQVISVEEVAETKKIAEEIGTPKNVKVGIMVETPAAVQVINDICELGIDFISFGTNDLTQFTLAIDRNNPEVQHLFNEMNPAILNSLRYVIRRCKKYGVETSICGQAGSREDMAAFLIQEGIDSISVNADAAQKVSMLVSKIENSSSFIEVESVHSMRHKEAGEKKAVAPMHKRREDDIESLFLKELEVDENGDYLPSLQDNKKDIPALNDAIPVSSDDFNPEESIFNKMDRVVTSI